MESAKLLARFLISSFIDAYKDQYSAENMETYCSQHYTFEEQEKVLNDSNYDVFFADKSGSEVGALVIHHHSCPLKPNLNSSELKQLYLLSSEYGTGLAKLLMEHSFELVKNQGNKWVWLCVSDLNYRAQRFYQKMNFEKIGEGPVLEVGTERLPSSIMLRRLNL